MLRFPGALLATVLPCLVLADDPPAYPEHQDLGYVLSDNGEQSAIKSTDDWKARRAPTWRVTSSI